MMSHTQLHHKRDIRTRISKEERKQKSQTLKYILFFDSDATLQETILKTAAHAHLAGTYGYQLFFDLREFGMYSKPYFEMDGKTTNHSWSF